MPKGDWIWPAIWFLPTDNAFGSWPASGEIDWIESRGNDASYKAGGRNAFGSTLHWGPDGRADAWDKAHQEYTHPTDLSDDFHTYGLEWTKDVIRTSIDGKTVLEFPFDKDMYTKGGFTDMENPWENESEINAPFN